MTGNRADMQLQEKLVHIFGFLSRFDIDGDFIVVHHLFLSCRNVLPTYYSLIFVQHGVIGVFYADLWFENKATIGHIHSTFDLAIGGTVEYCVGLEDLDIACDRY